MTIYRTQHLFVILIIILSVSQSTLEADGVDVSLKNLQLSKTSRLSLDLTIKNTNDSPIFFVREWPCVRLEENGDSRILVLNFGYCPALKHLSAEEYPSSVFLEPPSIELAGKCLLNLELSWQLRTVFPYVSNPNAYIGTPWLKSRHFMPFMSFKRYLPLQDGRDLKVKVIVAYGLQKFVSKDAGGERWKQFLNWQNMKTVSSIVATTKKKRPGMYSLAEVKYEPGPTIRVRIQDTNTHEVLEIQNYENVK